MTTNHESLVISILEALAVGDAIGMPTEFMTQKQIQQTYPSINGLLDPGKSFIHPDLPYASVTDDTEQNLFLMDAYLTEGKVTVENSARGLLRWIVESDAENKKYIGPSSLKALKAIEAGENPYNAGVTGTTCGGLMRTPSLVLCSPLDNKAATLNHIKFGCIPTHNTSQAIEAAVGYGFAFREAMLTNNMNAIMKSAQKYADKVIEGMDNVSCAPSCAKRIEKLIKEIPHIHNDDELLEELYYIYGTGLEAIDVFTAVFGIFLYVKEDVFRGILLAARIGGDTDTIAALVGALCAAYGKGHNIPEHIVRTVIDTNALDLPSLAQRVATTFHKETGK